MGGFVPAGNYDTQFTNLTTSGETTIFTVTTGDKAAYITHIWAADTGGVARTITFKATISSTDYTLVKDAAILANAPYDLEFMPIVLKTGDTIKATASNGSVHTFVSWHKVSRQT